jgi:CDK-activating kinase assembly factor MAT1
MENRELEREGVRELQARRAAEEERARQRRQEALLELEEERRERAEARNDVINKLASGDGDALKIARDGQKQLKKFKARKDALGRKLEDSLGGDLSTSASSSLIKGLKKKVKAEPEKPYDPFGGLSDEKRYCAITGELNLWDQYLGKARKDAIYTAGGYTVREFFTRALCEAFSGLGVFVSEEMAEQESKDTSVIPTQQDTVMADIS